MMKNRRTGRSLGRGTVVPGAVAFSASLLLLAACSSSPAAVPAPKPTPTSQGPYVALGDSYTSGPQIPDQVGSPAGCDR
jgi:hypothetical protein